jgi:hypothetical protein
MPIEHAFVPRPRLQGIVTEVVDGETLLYVEATHQASCLNAPAARIWSLCNGTRSVEDIASGASLQPEVVARAIGLFAHSGLLENQPEDSRLMTLSRRRVLAGVGLAAIPIILMVNAPKARAGASTCTLPGTTCNPLTPNTCCSGQCEPVGICG